MPVCTLKKTLPKTIGSNKNANEMLVVPVAHILKVWIFYEVTSLLWHSQLWSFQGRDKKLERFLAENQLYSNEITKF